jgi:hypothetical protein
MTGVALVIAGCAAAPPAVQTSTAGTVDPEPLPRVFVLRAEELAEARARIRTGDPLVISAFQRLKDDAADAMRAPLVAVTHKSTLFPPSGNTHDYFSLSPTGGPTRPSRMGCPTSGAMDRRTPRASGTSTSRASPR